MIIDRRSANAVGGKTARACDSCIRRRAHWYCTADDAFLCQGCDTSVHSANQLASRHERVRLGTSALKDSSTGREDSTTTPAWHQGFTKKARTRRNTNKSQLSVQEAKNEEKFFNPLLPLVPEIGSEETTSPFDDQVSYLQVPVFDPFADGEGMDYEHGEIDDLERFLLPSDMELAEFAADVESLLGGEIKKDRYDQENGGAHFCHDQGGRVKVEDVDEGEIDQAVLACQFDPMMDVMRETLDWNFDYESPMTGEEVVEEEKVVVVENMIMNQERKTEMRRRNISLKLNYEEVITSWANQKSPWTDGIRPEFNPDDDCWPDFMGMMCPTNFHHHNGEIGGVGGQVGSGDGAREARVSRYREKRRTRLFSKKIRYEVRKLNAEKRPRMRGRFVKRTSFAVPTTFPNYLNK